MLPRPHRHLASDKPTNVVAKKHRFRKAPNAHHSSPVMARPATRTRRMMESHFSGISNNIASEYRAMCSVEIANARGVIHPCKEQMLARAALPCGANKSINSGANSALPQYPWPSAATTTQGGFPMAGRALAPAMVLRYGACRVKNLSQGLAAIFFAPARTALNPL